eukprot:TRINITY_DN3024_c0_g1_i2.p1 TRINITY_DN3024_c0_g1~~TRINITY_DN3024_c0_g1_i2.p1  ORF type:complete len:385 (-),score=141.18 TRINITY_DN3024_c0_g1_i2:194-1276(-)
MAVLKGMKATKAKAVKGGKFTKQAAKKMAGKAGGTFEIFTGKAGKIWFRLKASNKEIILHSQGYKAVDGCKNGIESVKTHCLEEANFEKLESKKGQPYFTLKARNHEVIGTSQMYKSTASRDAGIKSVARWASQASVEDLTAADQEAKENEENEKEAEETGKKARKVMLKRPAAAVDEEAPVKKRPAAAAATAAGDEKDKALARKAELKAMLVADLKELVLKMGLEKGSKEAMIETVLEKEAKEREVERAAAVKRKQVLADKKKELEGMNLQSLKDLCEEKGLKSGGSKGDKIDRILGDVVAKGEVDIILANMSRAARREELSSMTKDELQKLCQKSKIDPIVKEVMVERILVHEAGVTF